MEKIGEIYREEKKYLENFYIGMRRIFFKRDEHIEKSKLYFY